MIWRDTMPIVQDFWLTGTGAGTYETVMLVYQRSSPGVRFNQAHNHYLQLASEGGLLLCLPALLVIVSFGVAAARRVGRDASGMYWIRSGALCVYHLAGIEAAAEDRAAGEYPVSGPEMVGAVRGIDPETGQFFDDTKRYVDAVTSVESPRTSSKIFEGNARTVYPRIKQAAQGDKNETNHRPDVIPNAL